VFEKAKPELRHEDVVSPFFFATCHKQELPTPEAWIIIKKQSNLESRTTNLDDLHT
jgi:hypothetical protein